MGDLPPFVHRKRAKGHEYLYFELTRPVAGRCRTQLIRLPEIDDPRFLEEYGKLRHQRAERRTPLKPKAEGSFVYFIGGDDGLIKIGRSRNPEARAAELQTGSPVPLRVLASVSGDSRLEAQYHRRFADFRVRGEWFERCPTLLNEIEILQGTNRA